MHVHWIAALTVRMTTSLAMHIAQVLWGSLSGVNTFSVPVVPATVLVAILVAIFFPILAAVLIQIVLAILAATVIIPTLLLVSISILILICIVGAVSLDMPRFATAVARYGAIVVALGACVGHVGVQIEAAVHVMSDLDVCSFRRRFPMKQFGQGNEKGVLTSRDRRETKESEEGRGDGGRRVFSPCCCQSR